MNNFRKMIFVIGLSGLILACGISGAPTSQTQGLPTIVAATLQALTSAAPAVTPQTGVPASFANVSFVIPTGMATGASAQTIAAVTDQSAGPWWQVAPQHTEFTLTGYGLPPGYFSEILIDIYPASEYAALNQVAGLGLKRLQAIKANPASALTDDTLPEVPYFNAAPMFAAQSKVISFANVSGVRMITQYGQAVGPIANNGTFYHFEGLTTDGKYLIVAVLPVQAPFLQNGNDPSAALPEGGIPFPGYNYSDTHYYDAYYKAITDKLNATDASSFQPSLDSLDGMIQSIVIAP